MRASNADVVAKEIEEYKAEVERKLKGMVAMFAHSASMAISENIPIGDPVRLAVDAVYAELYANREEALGIDAVPGFHRGALGYSESGNFQFMPIIFEAIEAADIVLEDVESYYNIGDSFFIGAKGPGYEALEGNSSDQTNGEGIAAPSERAIINIYKTDMKSFYDLA